MADAKPIDADNHYHESLDAFTRYQDKAMRKAAFRSCTKTSAPTS
jgi:hypothetical protein